MPSVRRRQCSPSGRIVNIASIWSGGDEGAGRSVISTRKTGLLGLTRAPGDRNSEDPPGSSSTAVSPGFVLTDLTRRSLFRNRDCGLCEQIPCRRMADPAERSAELVAIPCGAGHLPPGQNVVIDGGFTIVATPSMKIQSYPARP